MIDKKMKLKGLFMRCNFILYLHTQICDVQNKFCTLKCVIGICGLCPFDAEKF